jgi:AraC-like DNA-binding protein
VPKSVSGLTRAAKQAVSRTLDGATGAISVSEHTVRPIGTIELQCDSGAICIVCLDGTGTLDEGAGTYLMRDGFMVSRLARWKGRLTAGPKRLRVIQFSWTAAGLAALGAAGAGLRSARTLFGRSSVEMAWRAANELRLNDPLTPHALELLAYGVAIGLARNVHYGSGTEPPRAARARRLIDKNLTQPVNVAALARAAGCTPAHLSRLFRKTYGLPPAAYLLRRRVDKARQLLTDTDLSAAEIGRRLGFHDASHFGRHFRRHAGINPAAYRIRQRQVKNVPS